MLQVKTVNCLLTNGWCCLVQFHCDRFRKLAFLCFSLSAIKLFNYIVSSFLYVNKYFTFFPFSLIVILHLLRMSKEFGIRPFHFGSTVNQDQRPSLWCNVIQLLFLPKCCVSTFNFHFLYLTILHLFYSILTFSDTPCMTFFKVNYLKKVL